MFKAINCQSLGEAVLLKTLSSAYYGVHTRQAERAGSRVREGRECLAFIRDSGIHKIVHIYNLDIDPEKMKELFFYYVDVA